MYIKTTKIVIRSTKLNAKQKALLDELVTMLQASQTKVLTDALDFYRQHQIDSQYFGKGDVVNKATATK